VCVNEKRKCLIGCFDDWLLRSTIPIGWRLHSLREKSYAVFFACVIFLHLLRFLCTFYFACVFFLMRALRAFEWKPGLSESYRRHLVQLAQFVMLITCHSAKD